MYSICIMHRVNSTQTDGAMYLSIVSSWTLGLSYESEIFLGFFCHNHLEENLKPNYKYSNITQKKVTSLLQDKSLNSQS